jgi:hypothetical protein
MLKISKVIGGPFSLFNPLQVDRVYVSSPNVVAVIDHEKKHSFVIRKEGLPDVGKICCPLPKCQLPENQSTFQKKKQLLTELLISHYNHCIPVSCVESMGKEIEDHGRPRRRGVQADALR